MIAWFFRIGQFSLINDALRSGLSREMAEVEWREVDVERDIVGSRPSLHARAIIESGLRYGGRILKNRQPPRDFFPRVPAVISAGREWVRRNVSPKRSAFVFQTQSLFDARHPACPHFLYTDHTHLANLRYPEPRPLLPVAREWRDMERDLYRHANCTFVSSGFAAASVIEDYGVAPEKVECVYSGSNVAPAPAASREGRTILFVGVDWQRKGGPDLLKAFRRVRETFPSAQLWIVGCDPRIDEPGVKIWGRVSPSEMGSFYAKADIFCLPSRMDPTASVLAEAAINELPVVATPVGGNAERVVDGGTGFLCEAGELPDRLCRLLADEALRERMGHAGRRLVDERFTWAAVCAKIANRIRMTS